MGIFSDISLSFRSYLDAIKLIRTHKLSSLFILSCLAYIVIIILSAYIIYLGLQFTFDHKSIPSWLSTYTSWIFNFRWVLNIFLIGIYFSSFLVFISIYKYIFLAIASPLFAYISERSAEAINNKDYPFDFKQLVKDILRGILISFRNFSRQFLITLLLYILSFIPVVGFLFGFLILLTDCYYYGFSMLDYNCEREKMSISESKKFIKKHKGMAIGNGAIFYLSFTIPVIGLILIAPLSVIAASISFYKIQKN